MTRTILSTAFKVGRATALAIGVAVMVALVLGLASAALGADGGPFKLGKSNFAQSVTSLIKSGAGPALNLQVDSGPPLSVNSSDKVTDLNADLIDGQDSTAFLRNNTYFLSIATYGEDGPPNPNGRNLTVLLCDEGDLVLNASYTLVDDGTIIVESAERLAGRGWRLTWLNDATEDQVGLTVRCLDFGAPHQEPPA